MRAVWCVYPFMYDFDRANHSTGQTNKMEDTLQQQQQQQQRTFAHPSGYDASMNTAIAAPPLPDGVSHPYQSHPQQYPQQQQPLYPSPQPMFHPQQQQQQQQQLNAYSLTPPPAPPLKALSTDERATHLMAACESCLVVTRVPGVDMSFRRIMERKCPRCSGSLALPQEIMEVLILYGHFVS